MKSDSLRKILVLTAVSVFATQVFAQAGSTSGSAATTGSTTTNGATTTNNQGTGMSTTSESMNMNTPAGSSTTRGGGMYDQNTTNRTSADQNMMNTVQTRLTEDTALTGSSIAADVSNGTVTLTGTASSQAQVDAAMRAARSVSGVKDVRSNVTVQGQ